MIQFHNVQKNYKDNEFSIDDLSFRVDPGEFVFLIGPSGSGKTTVIKMLTREELPTNGKIFFDDFDITRLTRNSVYRLRRQIGVVFQDYKLIPDKTVYENVAFAMEVAGKKDHDIRETVPYLLDIVGLDKRADAFPDHLSGGEKQRVAIARAVSNNPRVLIADEPTGNLDPAAAWDIVQILSKINNWGTTVIMSTHGSDIVNTLNKRVIQMENGALIRDDNQGHYEKTRQEQKSEDKQEAIEPRTRRKGIIKVSLNRGEDDVKAVRSPGWWPFGNKNKDKDSEEQLSQDVIDDINDQAEELEAQEEEVLEKIVADAGKLAIADLDISQDLAERLATLGYNHIDDILNAGPEELTTHQIIGEDDVVQIAKAVEEFVEAEQNAWLEVEAKPEKPKKKPKPKKKVVEQEEGKAQKIKLDLTSKKL